MLQAIIKNKARKFLLSGDQRRPVEDVMTDCVFGGLRYFDPKTAGTILMGLLGNFIPADMELTDVQLWPRRSGVEPDAVLAGSLADGTAIQIIVECKWGANTLTREQVDRQRAAFADGRGRTTTTLQAYVVQDRSHVDEELRHHMSGSPADQRLLTWRDIAATLARAQTRLAKPEARRWAADVVAVLTETGERPFSGDWPRDAIFGPSLETLFYHDVERAFRWPSLVVPDSLSKIYYS